MAPRERQSWWLPGPELTVSRLLDGAVADSPEAEAVADLVAVRLDTVRTAGTDPGQVLLAAPAADERRDPGGRAVAPGFVESHTHLVFAGTGRPSSRPG